MAGDKDNIDGDDTTGNKVDGIDSDGATGYDGVTDDNIDDNCNSTTDDDLRRDGR